MAPLRDPFTHRMGGAVGTPASPNPYSQASCAQCPARSMWNVVDVFIFLVSFVVIIMDVTFSQPTFAWLKALRALRWVVAFWQSRSQHHCTLIPTSAIWHGRQQLTCAWLKALRWVTTHRLLAV